MNRRVWFPSLILLSLACFPAPAFSASTNWTDGGADSSWSNLNNWSNGIPGSTSTVNISTQPASGLIGVDTGSVTNQIQDFSFPASLTSGIQVVNAGVEQLQVSGVITNSTSFAQTFSLYVGMSGAAMTSGSGGLSFAGGLGLTRAVTNTGTGLISLGANNPTQVTIGASTGSITSSGSLDYNSSDLTIETAAADTPGDSFELFQFNSTSNHLDSVTFDGFYSGSLTQTSTGIWTGTIGGQSWKFTESTGLLLDLVPEPGLTGLLMSGVALMGATRRRRSGVRG